MDIITISSSILKWLGDVNWGVFLGGFGVASLLRDILLNSLKEKHESELKKREASISVADLLSEWVKSSYFNDHSNESRWKLQSLYWKTILRLDWRIIVVLFPLLANNKNAPNINDVVIKCRQILLGLKKPDLKAQDLNNWLPVQK